MRSVRPGTGRAGWAGSGARPVVPVRPGLLQAAGNTALQRSIGAAAQRGVPLVLQASPVVPGMVLPVVNEWTRSHRRESWAMLSLAQVAMAVERLRRLTREQLVLVNQMMGRLGSEPCADEPMATAVAGWQSSWGIEPTGWLDVATMFVVTDPLAAQGRYREIVLLLLNQYDAPLDAANDRLEIVERTSSGDCEAIWRDGRAVLEVPLVAVANRTAGHFRRLVHALWQASNCLPQLRRANGEAELPGRATERAFRAAYLLAFPPWLPAQSIFMPLAPERVKLITEIVRAYDQLDLGERTPEIDAMLLSAVQSALLDLEALLSVACPGGAVNNILFSKPELISQEHLKIGRDLFNRLPAEHRTPRMRELNAKVVELDFLESCD